MSHILLNVFLWSNTGKEKCLAINAARKLTDAGVPCNCLFRDPKEITFTKVPDGRGAVRPSEPMEGIALSFLEMEERYNGYAGGEPGKAYACVSTRGIEKRSNGELECATIHELFHALHALGVEVNGTLIPFPDYDRLFNYDGEYRNDRVKGRRENWANWGKAILGGKMTRKKHALYLLNGTPTTEDGTILPARTGEFTEKKAEAVAIAGKFYAVGADEEEMSLRPDDVRENLVDLSAMEVNSSAQIDA